MLFHEVQYAGEWVVALIGGTGLVLPALFIVLARAVAREEGQRPVAYILRTVAVIVVLLATATFLYGGKMTTEVDGAGVRVTFGWVPLYQRTVPAGDIASVEAVEYDPSDYGGSGIKGRAGDRLLSQRGTRGVQLTLKSGGRLLIGSEQAEELAEAVRQLGR